MHRTCRRNFLTVASSAAFAAATARCSLAMQTPQTPSDGLNDVVGSKESDNTEQTSRFPIAIFEKPFEGLSFDRLADCIVEIGADGVEATIRNGGHIEPQSASDEVPRMVNALEQRGKRLLIAATSVNRASKENESFLRMLTENDVSHYRLSHIHYDLKKPILPQFKSIRSQLAELAQLNAEIGIQGLYQTHSGSTKKRAYFGALALDLASALDGIDPSALGVAFDTRHVRKDTGSSFHLSIAALKPYIRSVYLKDGIWQGERSREYKNVALDTGFVDFDLFEELLTNLQPFETPPALTQPAETVSSTPKHASSSHATPQSLPLCIHMEWLGYRVFADQEIPDAVAGCKRDTETLTRWMAKLNNKS